jgi:hypothetical protein
MAANLTRLTHKIAIQLHLVAENCTTCSSRSRRSVRKLFGYTLVHHVKMKHLNHGVRVYTGATIFDATSKKLDVSIYVLKTDLLQPKRCPWGTPVCATQLEPAPETPY